jgi:hypothetical protein
MSLLLILGVLMAGELRSWSGWFVKGDYKPWYGYLYPGMLAAFGAGRCLFSLRTFRETEGTSEMKALHDCNLESLSVSLGLLLGLGLSIKNGLRGWANIYPKTFPEGESCWGEVFWRVVGPLMLICLAALLIWRLIPNRSGQVSENLYPRALRLMGLVLIVQNVIAQMVTGPIGDPRELPFNIYYLVLFLISAAIILYWRLAFSFSRVTAKL